MLWIVQYVISLCAIFIARMSMETFLFLENIGDCPLHGLQLKMNDSQLYSIQFVKKGDPVGLPGTVSGTGICSLAVNQLTAYFTGRLHTFTIPLAMNGTAFQKTVWGLIAEIPYGQTRTYKEIAEAAGSASLARAVGGAANRNPVPVIVPCHRVVGSSGALTGFAGGLEVKRFLLDFEQGILANM
jgi:methylated-DNA-[protein]-cysteine S-methyltransferase